MENENKGEWKFSYLNGKRSLKWLEGWGMNVYWKSTVNHMMTENEFNQSLTDVRNKILNWGKSELSLSGSLLNSFVDEKVEEYKRSFIKIEMPFHTEEECQSYLNHFYEAYGHIIQLFPYDRWTWIKKIESIQYGDYNILHVNVPSQLLDHKESPLT